MNAILNTKLGKRVPHNLLADASEEVKTVQVEYEGKIRGSVYYMKTFQFTTVFKTPQFVNFLEQNDKASFLTVDAKQKTTYVIQKVDFIIYFVEKDEKMILCSKNKVRSDFSSKNYFNSRYFAFRKRKVPSTTLKSLVVNATLNAISHQKMRQQLDCYRIFRMKKIGNRH